MGAPEPREEREECAGGGGSDREEVLELDVSEEGAGDDERDSGRGTAAGDGGTTSISGLSSASILSTELRDDLLEFNFPFDLTEVEDAMGRL